MKRLLAMILTVLTVFTLAACGGKSATVNAPGLGAALAERVQFDSEMSAVSEEELGIYLDLPVKCDIGAYMSSSTTAEVIFVVECYNKTDAAALKVSVQSFLDEQKQEMGRYMPEEVARLNKAIFSTYGTCVVLCVTSDTSTANAVIKEYVG